MKLAYVSIGEGPILVLLHPVGLDREFWGGAVQLLANKFTVLAIDLAGHGGSPDCNYSRMSDYVADVANLVGSLHGGPAVLVGSSFGGMIAQELALTYPALVSALVVCASPARIGPETAKAALSRARQAQDGGMASIVPSTLKRWFSEGFIGSDVARRVATRLASNKPGNWASAWTAISGHDCLARLPVARCRSLIVSASADASIPIAAEIELAQALPNSRLVVLPGAPHIMQLEQPEAFGEVLSDYLLLGWWLNVG